MKMPDWPNTHCSIPEKAMAAQSISMQPTMLERKCPETAESSSKRSRTENESSSTSPGWVTEKPNRQHTTHSLP